MPRDQLRYKATGHVMDYMGERHDALIGDEWEFVPATEDVPPVSQAEKEASVAAEKHKGKKRNGPDDQ